MPSHDVTQLAHDGTTALPKLARKPYMQIGSKVFYLSNRTPFLWVYRRDKPRGMLGEHEKSL